MNQGTLRLAWGQLESSGVSLETFKNSSINSSCDLIWWKITSNTCLSACVLTGGLWGAITGTVVPISGDLKREIKFPSSFCIRQGHNMRICSIAVFEFRQWVQDMTSHPPIILVHVLQNMLKSITVSDSSYHDIVALWRSLAFESEMGEAIYSSKVKV